MASQKTEAAAKPAWLSDALAATKIKKGKPIEGLAVDALPPLFLDGWRADRDCLDLILAALQRSTPDVIHPFILELRNHRAHRNFDAFAWEALEQWIDSGAPPKQKWLILGVTLLGSEMLMFRLIPFVRKWRSLQFFERAKFGLECLRASGEPVALSEISEMNYLVSLGSLQKRAREIMERLAHERGMSIAEVEDRIVPDCGLTGEGRREFSYGARSFRLIIHNLKPAVMDDDGNKYETLPAPEPGDDAHLAEIAAMDWQVVREVLQSIVDAQTIRLEQAMINERRWTRRDFEQFLLSHPIMQHLVKLVVWAAHDADGKMIGTFRVAEDNTLADERDAPTALPGCTEVSIVHPCLLPADIRGHWGEVFTDYEIAPLFPQLGRPLFGLERDEEMKKTIERGFPAKVSGGVAGKALLRMNWTSGSGGPMIHQYARHFHAHNLTAVVDLAPPLARRGADQDVVRVLFFLKGIRTTDLHFENERIALCFVPPQLLSEALHDLTAASVPS